MSQFSCRHTSVIFVCLFRDDYYAKSIPVTGKLQSGMTVVLHIGH
jgi:hypothetical protein